MIMGFTKELDFVKSTFGLLKKACDSNETITVDEKYDFYTKTGIKRLDIRPNSYFELKYLPSGYINDTYKTEFHNLKESKHRLVLIFYSAENDEIVERRLKDYYPDIKIISYKELESNLEELIHYTNPEFVSRDENWKCLNIKNIFKFYNYILRCEIVKQYFDSGRVNESIDLLAFDKHSFASDRLTPFVFTFNERKYLFTSSYQKNEEEITRVIIKQIEKADYGVHVLLNGKPVFIEINIDMINDYLNMFVHYVDQEIDDDDFYKYKELNNWAQDSIKDATIYFSCRDNLNDPFDLDVQVTTYLKDCVLIDYPYRLFCVTKDPLNILMWSHYGNSHKGITMKYKCRDIISSITSCQDIDYCYFGKVAYRRMRPNYRDFLSSTAKYLPTTFLDNIFTAIVLFSKFKAWEYEQEYRFVPMFKSVNSGYSLNVDYKEIIGGALISDADRNWIETNVIPGVPNPIRVLQLDSSEYKLN